MSFDETFYDRQTKPQLAAIRGIAFEFVEEFFKLFFWNACAIVDYQAFDYLICVGFTSTKDDPAVCRMSDRVADQVLKDALQKTGICVNGQITRHFVDEFGTAGFC